ncbi:MAG: GNAT family N-acetyltransferase [Spirochaetia bacterium]
MPPRFRIMNEDDAESVSALIHLAFQQFIADTYTARGIKHFRKNTSKQAMLRRKLKNQLIVVAEADDKISGMIAVRKGNHITLLFVAPEFHRTGIGTLLFQDALNHMKATMPDLRTVTVNSSQYALPFYTRLGFTVKRSAYLHKGMKITPMELLLLS